MIVHRLPTFVQKARIFVKNHKWISLEWTRGGTTSFTVPNLVLHDSFDTQSFKETCKTRRLIGALFDLMAPERLWMSFLHSWASIVWKMYWVTGVPRTLLMLMFSIADQGPIEGWALTHAMHHVASEAGWHWFLMVRDFLGRQLVR